MLEFGNSATSGGFPRKILLGRFSADDWGLSPGVNEGILRMGEAGLLNSVSVMANLPYFEHGLSDLLKFKIPLVAHLNFTLGRPISRSVPSLCDKRGELWSFKKFFLKGILGSLDSADIFAEASSQLEFLTNRIPVEALNCHQHLHLVPWVVAPLAKAARNFGLKKIRWTIDPGHIPSWVGSFWVHRQFKKHWPEVDREATLCLSPTGRWTQGALSRRLRQSDAPLVIHPAAKNDFGELRFADSLQEMRVHEFHRLMEISS